MWRPPPMRPRSTAQAQAAAEDRHPGAAEEASPAEDPAEADANIRSPRSCFQTNQDNFLAESHSRRRSGCRTSRYSPRQFRKNRQRCHRQHAGGVVPREGFPFLGMPWNECRTALQSSLTQCSYSHTSSSISITADSDYRKKRCHSTIRNSQSTPT